MPRRPLIAVLVALFALAACVRVAGVDHSGTVRPVIARAAIAVPVHGPSVTRLKPDPIRSGVWLATVGIVPARLCWVRYPAQHLADECAHGDRVRTALPARAPPLA